MYRDVQSSAMSKSELRVRIAPDPAECQVRSATSVYDKLLTAQEAQSIANRVLGHDVKVQKYSLQPFSAEKVGFLGSHQRLCIDVKTKRGTETLSFFVKVIPFDVPPQADYVIEKCVFVKETIFYRDIVPLLYQVYKGEPWTSPCYLVKDSLLVFEDLNHKGYSIRDKLFNKELIVSGLTAIARIHASSLMAEKRLGTSLKKMYPDAFVENAFCHTGKTRAWFDAGISATVAIAEHLGLDASLIPEACEEVFLAMKTSPTKQNVVSHGDLWGNNLMFSGDVPPKCLLVDFQLLRYCPLAHDVAQFLYLCTDRNFRETWEETMLKHYYNVLRETINSADSVTIDVPPWSDIVEGMEEQRLGALITAVMYYQTILLSNDFGCEIFNNSANYKKYTFQNRDSVVLESMKKDPVYYKRLSGAVGELVELSFRLNDLPKPK